MSKSKRSVNEESGRKFIRKGSGKLTMPEPKIIRLLDLVAKLLAVAQGAVSLLEKIFG